MALTLKLTVRVVLAADRGGGATQPRQTGTSQTTSWQNIPGITSADADDGDRGAGEPDKGVNILHDDPDGAQNARSSGIAGLRDGVTALKGCSAAVAG